MSEDTAEIDEELASSVHEEGQSSADPVDDGEQGMIAGNEADIVDPEQIKEEVVEQAEQEPAPDASIEEELNATEEVTPEQDAVAPEDATPEEAAPEEDPVGEDLSVEGSSDDTETEQDETVSDETDT